MNQPFPFPDALQEFSVQTSTLSARYGLHPGATVNAVTKSGTNYLHGNVFEFLRNGSLNARNFFAATHDTLKRNQFGGTLGGPIRKDKLFFFGGYQGTRNRQAPPQSLAILPTPRALQGDFSVLDSAGCQSTGRGKTLIDPTSGTAFPNNFIPPSRFSTPAVNLVTKYLPAPGDACGNLRYGIPVTGDEDQYIGKIDWVQSAKHTLFGRYFIADYSDPAVFDGSNVLTAAKPGVVDRAQNLVVGDTYSFTSSVVNGFHARASRTRVNRGEPSNMINPKTLGVDINPLVPNHIDMTVSGAFTLGCGTCAPAHFMTNSYQVADDVDAVSGHHQLSFGGQIIRNQLNWLAHTLSNGQFTINGQSTGDSLADLMLGQLSSFQEGGPLATWWRQSAIGLYAHDVWRATPNLTLNFGVRWEPFLPESDIYAQGEHFDLNAFLAGQRSSVYSNAPPGFFYYGDPGIPKSSTFRRLADFEPRVGLAWQPTKDSTTIRAAYGIFYQNPPILYPERFGQVSPFGNTVQLASPAGGLADPLEQIGGDPFPFPFPPAKDAPFVAFGTFLNMPLHIHPNYVQQWNVSLQRQFRANWLASATYLGNKSTHLWLQNEEDPGVYVPGASTTANTNQRRILYRLNPAANAGGLVSSITLADDGGNSHYNGLMLALNHRFSRNFSGLANYTWSHCLGSGDFTSDLFSPQMQNPYDRQSEYGNCIFDHRQIFNLSLIAQTPSSFSNAMLRHLLGGWETFVIASRRTGDFLSLASGKDNSFSGIGLDRPDVVGDSHLSNPTLAKYFNTAAFQQNQPGQFGNSGRDSIVGPNQFNIDFGLSRRFQFHEARAIEIRSEFFNILNHPNFGDPNTTLTNARFGAITSAADPRILQFALKFAF